MKGNPEINQTCMWCEWIESEESNNFLNPELAGNPRLILMDDYGEVRKNFWIILF